MISVYKIEINVYINAARWRGNHETIFLLGYDLSKQFSKWGDLSLNEFRLDN